MMLEDLLLGFVLLALVGGLGFVLWAIQDRKAWFALGPGGLPSTWAGWWRVTQLRRHKLDPLDLAIYDRELDQRPAGRHLGVLAERAGPRPAIAPHPIPHRQLNQQASTQFRQRLAELFQRAVERHSPNVLFKLSHFERHTEAVTLSAVDAGHHYACLSHGEVAHIHPSDGSMHMIMSPADAKAVVAAGWGERHPLAGAAQFPQLPTAYVLIYSPRDELELTAVEAMLEASIGHMSGRAASLKASEGPAA